MKCLLVYDIPDDRARTKIADFCLDYGLDRIQYSAFVGDLSRTHQEELMLKIKKRLGKKAGNIQLFPVCGKDWENRLEWIQQEAGVGQKAGGSEERLMVKVEIQAEAEGALGHEAAKKGGSKTMARFGTQTRNKENERGSDHNGRQAKSG